MSARCPKPRYKRRFVGRVRGGRVLMGLLLACLAAGVVTPSAAGQTERSQRQVPMAEVARCLKKGMAANRIVMKAHDKRKEGDLLSAARLFEQAAELVKGCEEENVEDYLELAAKAYADQGMTKGDRQSLEKCVFIYRELLAKTIPYHAPRRWAMAQNNLGNALLELGRRRSDPALIQEAIEAQEAALEVASQAGNAHYVKAFSANLAKSRQALAEMQAGGK